MPLSRGCLYLLHPIFCPSSAHFFSRNLSSWSNFWSSVYVADLIFHTLVSNFLWFSCSVFKCSGFSVHSTALAAAVVAEKEGKV